MIQSPSMISPIHGLARKLGAQFVEIAGWQVPQVYQTVEEEVATARHGLALADASSSGKIVVEGAPSAAVLQVTWAMPATNIGQGVIGASGRLYRLRKEQFFIHIPAGQEQDVTRRLIEVTQETGERVTVTDITHGRADLLLVGPSSPVLLSRLCGVDFHPGQFPDLTAKQSTVAKTRQLILRRDMGDTPAYSLIGARSLAAYLWGTILEAGSDLDIGPIGQAALERLQQDNRSRA
jgi:aminomethyltransferase